MRRRQVNLTDPLLYIIMEQQTKSVIIKLTIKPLSSTSRLGGIRRQLAPLKLDWIYFGIDQWIHSKRSVELRRFARKPGGRAASQSISCCTLNLVHDTTFAEPQLSGMRDGSRVSTKVCLPSVVLIDANVFSHFFSYYYYFFLNTFTWMSDSWKSTFALSWILSLSLTHSLSRKLSVPPL